MSWERRTHRHCSVFTRCVIFQWIANHYIVAFLLHISSKSYQRRTKWKEKKIINKTILHKQQQQSTAATTKQPESRRINKFIVLIKCGMKFRWYCVVCTLYINIERLNDSMCMVELSDVPSPLCIIIFARFAVVLFFLQIISSSFSFHICKCVNVRENFP